MAKDPYRYFRVEARELQEGLTRGILALEKGLAPADAVASLLRLAHTLKGAARVVKLRRISELAHGLEEQLAPYRDGNATVPKHAVTGLLQVVDGIGAGITELDNPVSRPAHMSAAPAVEEPLESVRVNIAEMDTLLDGLVEIGSQLSALRCDSVALQGAVKLSAALHDQLHRAQGRDAAIPQVLLSAEELRKQLRHLNDGLAVGIEQLGAELSQARNIATQLRLLPAEMIFPALERTARDAAHALQKETNFSASGGDTRLDAHVLAALRDAMLQVVRNAVAHGIELPAQRMAAGKSSVGSIQFSVERRGNRVIVACRDDGNGIDVAAVQRAAVQRGLLPEDKAAELNIDGAVQLILKGGVSTTTTASEVSGRGIGLDLVRSTAARLKGTVAIRTGQGGTTVEICVPISLASLNTLRVEAGGRSAALPLDAVTRTLRISANDLSSLNDKITLSYPGRALPYVSLAELLAGGRDAEPGSKARLAVILESSQGAVALGIDRLLGTANIVLRPVPPPIHPEHYISGASLDSDGNPELVLDPAGIAAAAAVVRAPQPASNATPSPPVLVIDDSLTTRMLEQSILESAGFEVELAVSAEDGLERARARKFGIIIVDVEMPGMDGFQFVEQAQTDPALRDTPCILVTSRNAPEDRQRGKKAGAKAYIVKSEFDQDYLVRTIRDLMG